MQALFFEEPVENESYVEAHIVFMNGDLVGTLTFIQFEDGTADQHSLLWNPETGVNDAVVNALKSLKGRTAQPNRPTADELAGAFEEADFEVL